MSELLNELFAAEHRVPRQLLARLEASELRELEATVRGEAHKPYRVRAMGALVDARGAGATGVLAQVLSRRNEDSAVRAAAAFQLGRAGPPAEKQLIAAIRGRPQTTVAFAAAGALAKVGTPAAIPPLKALAKRDDALGAQARFAATVVAFRHHLKGQEPRASARAKILELPRRGRAPLFSRELERPEALAAFEDLRHDTYGIRLAPGRSLRLDCGPERYLIALNPDAADLDRPNIAGLVAQRAPTDNSYSVSRLVLTWRGRNGVINIGVFRPSGQQALAGTATEKGQRTTFRIQSVAARGNPPVDIRGTLEAGKIVQMTGSAAAIRPTRSAPTAE